MDFVKEDVVISGIGGYFPQSANIEQLMNNLLENKDLVGTRWRQGERGVTNHVGTVPTEFFDNSFFGIHRQQCTFMDPMQRLILERTFEALIDAGVNPTEVKGKRIGVFMGSAIGENDNLFLESIVSGFGVTGHSRAMMPNRVSYWLNLKGPSVAYDSNWVGGMEVLKLAYDAIKTGQCESVIVGTANLALNSEFQWLYNDMGLLSPDGKTRAFDAKASGYARSDGIVVLYIQKASKAKRIYASIVKVATVFDGNRNGNLLEVNVPNMVQFLNEFYENIPDVSPEDVQYLETYGCGHKVTDEKELAAIEQVYCKNRKDPLLIGSIKSNTGHSEASAVMFSLAKALIALESGIIPANINFEKPNPNIMSLAERKIKVVSQNTKWNSKYVAINALGLDSYYGHILLKGNDKPKTTIDQNLPRLVLASTRTEDGIKTILEIVKSKKNESEYYQLLQDLFTKPIMGHLFRGYCLVGSIEPVQEFEYLQGTKRQIWFVYSGMGSQWNGMIGDFMRLSVFEDSINKSAEILKKQNVDLKEILSTMDKTIFDNILHSFVGIAAIQIALTDVLKAIGIKPDGIIGHSVGELGCAYADECITAEEMILGAYYRGRASLESKLIPGMMAAVGQGFNVLKNRVPSTIEVACHNGPDSATLSGPKKDMEKYVAELQAQGVFARLVNVAGIAYHSRYIQPAAPKLLQYMRMVLSKSVKRSVKWISTSNPEENWNSDLAQHCSPEYLTNNLLSPVLFEEGLNYIPKDSILIEIAPHGLLQAILKRSVKSGCTNIALTQRGCKSSLEYFLSSLGKMFLAGMDMSVSNIYPKIPYPVGKGTPSLAPLTHWNHTESWRTGLEDKLHSLFSVTDIQVTLNSEDFRECVGHQLDENIILPASFYLNIAYTLISNISSGHKQILFENLHFQTPLRIPKIGSVPLHAMVQKGSGEFEITSNKEIIMTGKMSFPQPNEKFMSEHYLIEVGEDNIQLSGSDIYNEFYHRGCKYSGPFKGIKCLHVTEEGSKAVVQWTKRWTMLIEAMIEQCILLAGEKNQDIQIPKNIQKICIDQTKLPNENLDLTVDFDYATGVIATEGLQIIGVQTTVLEKEKKSLYIHSIEYVPLTNSIFSRIETGICVALQLMLNNFSDEYITNIIISEIESERPIMKNIKTALSQYPKLNPNIEKVTNVQQVSVQPSYPLLIIYNDNITDEIAKIITSTHAFMLTRASKGVTSYQNIVIVADFICNKEKYLIIKKANNANVVTVRCTTDTLNIKDLKRSSAPWVSDLYKAVESAAVHNQRVFLISPVIPQEGFLNFRNDLKLLPNFSSLRILCDLESKESINYAKVFKSDLSLSILRKNNCYAYLSIPVKFKDNIVQNVSLNNIIKNTNVSHLGVNLRDETLKSVKKETNKLGLLDYSGVTSTGQKVMGIATLKKDNCCLHPDDIYLWKIPDNWSTEDAATIPYAFVSAYYILFIKGKLQPGETILIHGGCTSIGLASICIAIARGCNVYTTVSTPHQRSYLKQKFVNIKDQQILRSDNASFASLFMMATGGKGANVITNSLSGSLLKASLACVADFGRFIHIGKFDVEESNTIGMQCFLRSTSFFAVDLCDIVNQPKNIKEELKCLVENGLTNISVRPLTREVVSDNDIGAILSKISNMKTIGKAVININNSIALHILNISRPTQFVCDQKNSYLVYGGNVEQCVDITQWLVYRGAKKIVVTTEGKRQQNHISRRLSLLQAYFGVDIIHIPKKHHTPEGAAELLSEVYFLGPIHAVFLLPNKNTELRIVDIKPVQHIDCALRTIAPKAIFVNFITYAAGICQARSDAGFTTYNLEWFIDLEFSDVLTSLDDILILKVKNVLVNNDKVSDTKEESAQALFKKLSQILPALPEKICAGTEYAPRDPEIIQIVTEGPREVRELIPLFIIPGLNTDKEIEQLGKRLLVPTFLAVLPSALISIKQLAHEYAKKIQKIWSSGPYNLVGISWGGILVLEIAKILDRSEARIHIYFIDGAPSTIQSTICRLGRDTKNIEINLLTRIFNNNDTQIIQKLQSLDNWDARLQYIMNVFANPLVNKTYLGHGLTQLKNRLHDALSYKPTEHLVSGSTHLIRPSECSEYDNCDLTIYCKQTPQVCLVNGDHISIINHKDTAEYINETFQLI